MTKILFILFVLAITSNGSVSSTCHITKIEKDTDTEKTVCYKCQKDDVIKVSLFFAAGETHVLLKCNNNNTRNTCNDEDSTLKDKPYFSNVSSIILDLQHNCTFEMLGQLLEREDALKNITHFQISQGNGQMELELPGDLSNMFPNLTNLKLLDHDKLTFGDKGKWPIHMKEVKQILEYQW